MKTDVVKAMIVLSAIAGTRAIAADDYGLGLITKGNPEGRQLGGLMEIDGRVFVANEQGQDRWFFKRQEKGTTVRLDGGPRTGWYLTGDKQGRVSLSKEPEEGSYWETQFQANPTFRTSLTTKGLKGGHWILAADEEASTYTDGAGKEHTVRRVKLSEKEGSVFRGVLASP